MDLIPGWEGPLEEGLAILALQYSCLENPRDRGLLWAMAPKVEKSWTQLKQLSTHASRVTVCSFFNFEPVSCWMSGSNCCFLTCIQVSQEGFSRVFSKITVQKSIHASALSFLIVQLSYPHLRRQWHPTPALLLGESLGWGSLMGCCLWGRTESDMTEVT